MGTVEIQRYERKFLVTEHQAEAIRSFVTGYLPIDEHVTPDKPRGYQVYSLYLDTHDFLLYRQSCQGIKNRYKLRIRVYDPRGDGPAFLEIKSRNSETVRKMRANVPRRAAESLLRGGWISSADLLTNGEASTRALNEFCQRRERQHAEGMVWVSYMREAFVSPTAEAVRVTFDRNIAGRHYDRLAGLTVPDEESFVPVKGVLLELKYNGRAPRWMHDLITTFGIQRNSFSKYVHCMDALRIVPGMGRGSAPRSVRC